MPYVVYQCKRIPGKSHRTYTIILCFLLYTYMSRLGLVCLSTKVICACLTCKANDSGKMAQGSRYSGLKQHRISVDSTLNQPWLEVGWGGSGVHALCTLASDIILNKWARKMLNFLIHTYEHLIFHTQLRWAWKMLYVATFTGLKWHCLLTEKNTLYI